MGQLLQLTVGAVLAASPAPARPLQSDEIQTYVLITAVAQTASDRCSDILVNNDMLKSAPAFFHLTAEDEPAARLTYNLEMKRLAAAIDGAPSAKVWCDAAYRAYGPDGDVVKGLLSR